MNAFVALHAHVIRVCNGVLRASSGVLSGASSDSIPVTPDNMKCA